MENEKEPCKIEIEADYLVDMAAATLNVIMRILYEKNQIAALLAWAKASFDVWGYDTAMAALDAIKKASKKREEEENGK